MILDEFTAMTGHHRKHGIRLLGGPAGNKGKQVVGRRIYDEGRTRRGHRGLGRPLTAAAANGLKWCCPTWWTSWSGIGTLEIWPESLIQGDVFRQSGRRKQG